MSLHKLVNKKKDQEMQEKVVSRYGVEVQIPLLIKLFVFIEKISEKIKDLQGAELLEKILCDSLFFCFLQRLTFNSGMIYTITLTS